MERLTKKCAIHEVTDGKYLPYTIENYSGVYPDSTLGKLVERLAYYENLEEQGKLMVLDKEDKDMPCHTCEIGWYSVSMFGSRSCKDDCQVLKEHIKSVNGY